LPETPAFTPFQSALMLLGHVYFSPIIGTLVRRNVPDHLDNGPLSATDLARLTETDALSLTRALRALSSFGAFQEVAPGVFANSPVSDLFRNRTAGLRNCALFYGSDHYLKSATALGHSVVTGQSATQHVHGESVWEHFRKHPEEAEAFNRALGELRGNEHQQIADAYDWSGVNTVVDVGGGVGSLLVAILEKRPAMRGVLLEQTEVLSHAEPVLSQRGVRDRVEFIAGSFLDPIAAVGDVWTMCQVLHDWPDAQCLTILQRCRDAMRPTDRLLVAEMIPVPCQPNIPISMVDMAMLMYFGEARQRTADEYSQLFEATQFKLTQVIPTASAFSIVEARPV